MPALLRFDGYSDPSECSIHIAGIRTLGTVAGNLTKEDIHHLVIYLRTSECSRDCFIREGVKLAPVKIGRGGSVEAFVGPLSNEQVSGLLDGSSHVYLFLWAGWTGADRRYRDVELYAIMQRPASRRIQGSDAKNWISSIIDEPRPQPQTTQ